MIGFGRLKTVVPTAFRQVASPRMFVVPEVWSTLSTSMKLQNSSEIWLEKALCRQAGDTLTQTKRDIQEVAVYM